MKKILPLFSYLFHPIFISLYAAVLYFLIKDDFFPIQEVFFILLQIVIITVIVPLLFFLILRTTGNADSIMVHETAQRKIPMALQCFLFILLIKRTVIIARYPELHFFFLGALFSTLIATILLFFKIKASIHMLSISALTIFIIGLALHLHYNATLWISFLILMNGFVATSRLEMKAHSIFELNLGCLLGILPQLLFLYLWL